MKNGEKTLMLKGLQNQKKSLLSVILVLIAVISAGCSNSQASMEDKMLSLLQDKYDIGFEIVKSNYDEYGAVKALTATVCPVGNDDLTFTAYLNSVGKSKDDYHVALMKEQVKDYYSVLCEKDYILDYEIVVDGHQTNDDLTGMTFEEYLEERSFYVTLYIQFYDGKTDEEYADEIYSLLSDIDSFEHDVYMLNIDISDNVNIFCDNLYNINSENGQGLEYYSRDMILREIDENRNTSDFINSVLESESNKDDD